MSYALCLLFIQIAERERKLADLEPVMQEADRSFKQVASRGGEKNTGAFVFVLLPLPCLEKQMAILHYIYDIFARAHTRTHTHAQTQTLRRLDVI